MKTPYNPANIEQAAQTYWAENNTFEAKLNPDKEKFFCLSMLPYPSGELHMGHVRNYTIGDVIARYQHMLGKNVLHPMGWDAFGLPAENAALKHKLAPSDWTYKNIADMRMQFQRMGYAFDWQRELATCSPAYYRWEQWLFIRMLKKGLAYRKNAVVNWDPVDNTVLANEQVIDGRGWRSGALIERREIPQWFLRITDYADELLSGLEHLPGWPEQVRTMQAHWIGRSYGLEVAFKVAQSSEVLHIYTTRPDTLMGATYLAIAPEHPLALAVAEKNPAIAAFLEKCRHRQLAESALATAEKEGLDTGLQAIHPITQETLPIWVANYVLMEYGSGAVMAVPAHDQRDFEFAHQYDLPIKPVIRPVDETSWDFQAKAFCSPGILVHSGEFSGFSSEQAFEAIAEQLSAKNQGKRCTHYRLRDWGISRQRYWGTPIPIIYCVACGAVPVPEKDLPVILPEHIVLTAPVSPLKSIEAFYQTACPQCGGSAQRETDTFDTFMESSWYYARYTCVDYLSGMLDTAQTRYWMPVDQYIGGIEHAVLHLLYARFIYKVLRDEGLISGNEPFQRLLTQGMVLKDGVKMSKSKGNIVSPSELIDRFGADTVRLFTIFASPPEQSLEWSDSGVEGAYRFLKRLWQWAEAIAPVLQANREQQIQIDHTKLSAGQQNWRREIHTILQQANADIDRLQLNTVVSGAMKILNVLTKMPMEDTAAIMTEGCNVLLRLLAPITPHICHVLWRELGFGENVLQAGWPEVDPLALQSENMTLVVQVNGKLRGQITLPCAADQTEIQNTALREVTHVLEGKTVRKYIIVPGRLVNVVC